MTERHRVVIVGGGFGGLGAAKALKRAPVDVTIIDKRNFHLFQPLLYQVATGGLSPGDISAPIRAVLKHNKNTRVLLGEVAGIDSSHRKVMLADGHHVPYDTLIVATGVSHDYFGHREWETSAPGLKTIEDATSIRARIFIAFEAAERASDPALRAAYLTFVVVGGGPTGVELAGALGEIAHDTLKHDFRNIQPESARIILVEGRLGR
jgi:NADH dehydrogenase